MFLKSPPSLILASTSKYRRELLARLRLPFSCSAPGVDETGRSGERPITLATRLARAKAAAVALQHPDAWVIGSDQVAVRTGSLGRAAPRQAGYRNALHRAVASLLGSTVSFLTAVALVRHNEHAVHEFLDTTQVVFRRLDQETIARYVALEMPLDCAGRLQERGARNQSLRIDR